MQFYFYISDSFKKDEKNNRDLSFNNYALANQFKVHGS